MRIQARANPRPRVLTIRVLCVLATWLAMTRGAHASVKIWEPRQTDCFCSVLSNGYQYAVTAFIVDGMRNFTVDAAYGAAAPEPGESILTTELTHGPGGAALLGRSTPARSWFAVELPADRMVRYVHTKWGGWSGHMTFDEGCEHARPIQDVLDFYVSIDFDGSACYAKVRKALDLPKPADDDDTGCSAALHNDNLWAIFGAILALMVKRGGSRRRSPP